MTIIHPGSDESIETAQVENGQEAADEGERGL
jgi:hypothetical protein